MVSASDANGYKALRDCAILERYFERRLRCIVSETIDVALVENLNVGFILKICYAFLIFLDYCDINTSSK
jgi:hypothetical protein